MVVELPCQAPARRISVSAVGTCFSTHRHPVMIFSSQASLAKWLSPLMLTANQGFTR